MESLQAALAGQDGPQGLAAAYLGGEYKLLATFIVLVVILMLRPYGLFGTRDIERV